MMAPETRAVHEVTLHVTPAELGLLASGIRLLRKKAAKNEQALIAKFGDEAIIMTHRAAALESVARKIEVLR